MQPIAEIPTDTSHRRAPAESVNEQSPESLVISQGIRDALTTHAHEIVSGKDKAEEIFKEIAASVRYDVQGSLSAVC